MPEKTSYEPGSPTWVELYSPDVEASKTFYKGLFGWDSYTVTIPDMGDYEMFTVGGATGPEVAGMAPLADETERPGWICYFRVTDVDTSLEVVRDAGGQVFSEGTDVAHLGRMAHVTDTEGAAFGLWQPYAFPGAALIDEPGAMSWVGLVCRDIDAAERFYGRVLGWKEPARFQGVVGDLGFEWQVAGRFVTGVVFTGESLPPEVPAHWLPTFAVADCDAAVSAGVRLGGKVWMDSTETPQGRFAVLIDPTGGIVAIIQLAG
ncbi:VOC family protein [Actinomadura viridis]|uniref:VOC family protein n=1 Tax=Actinomadura viridis TaxID=58110 RepID=UPI0036C5265E